MSPGCFPNRFEYRTERTFESHVDICWIESRIDRNRLFKSPIQFLPIAGVLSALRHMARRCHEDRVVSVARWAFPDQVSQNIDVSGSAEP